MLALGVLVWTVSGTVNAWLVAALAYLGILQDTQRLEGASSFLDLLLSEGLNQPLVFLFLAALFAYLKGPGRILGLVLGLLLALLILTRPANAVLALVLGALWLFHCRHEGLKRATARTALIAVALAAPLLFACGRNWKEHGAFKLHAFGGSALLGNAFPLATVDDIEAFEDPEIRELLRICLVEEADRRIVDFTNLQNVGINLWTLAAPAYEKTFKGSNARSPFFRDEIFSTIGKRLIARRPLAFARIVLFHLGMVGRTTMVLALLCAGAALILYRRTGRWLFLYAFIWCAAPFVAIVPACVFTIPTDRYLAPFFFAEVLALPLLAVIAMMVWNDARWREV